MYDSPVRLAGWKRCLRKTSLTMQTRAVDVKHIMINGDGDYFIYTMEK